MCRIWAAARARTHSVGVDIVGPFQVVLGLQVIQGDVMKLDLPYFDICVANIPYQVHVLELADLGNKGWGRRGSPKLRSAGQ